ncbi:MAG: succinate dehydrogenase, cytochrome b556 subunit, partial [Alphaproteobacteria bacterium]|nr:succinate dehydrogenase, cytochrome b556 subunit [Alphaproteobacteria bacterium]
RRGLDIETVRLLGMGCIAGSVVLTALTLIIINL